MLFSLDAFTPATWPLIGQAPITMTTSLTNTYLPTAGMMLIASIGVGVTHAAEGSDNAIVGDGWMISKLRMWGVITRVLFCLLRMPCMQQWQSDNVWPLEGNFDTECTWELVFASLIACLSITNWLPPLPRTRLSPTTTSIPSEPG